MVFVFRLDLAVSAMYVREHVKKGVKETAEVIVQSVLQEVIKLLHNADWMDKQTR